MRSPSGLRYAYLIVFFVCCIFSLRIFLRNRDREAHAFGVYEEQLFFPKFGTNSIKLRNESATPEVSWMLRPTESRNSKARDKGVLAKYVKPRSDDVVLILKTGQSTPSDRLKAQLETFASAKYGRNPSNTILISDAPQTLEVDGVVWEVLDVINDLSDNPDVSQSNKYQIYLNQKESAAAGRKTETSDPPGSNNNGWTLDALKFLPGYKRAAEKFPEAKWFIGLDDDNYLMWDSALEFLSLLDPDEKLYIGSPSYMIANGVKFIHGGSVTISSRAAVKARFLDGEAGLKPFHKAAIDFCCGDAILAMAYADIGIEPNDRYKDFFNGESPQSTIVTPSKFCQPLLGLHHLEGDQIRALDRVLWQKRIDDKRDPHAFTTWGQYLTMFARSQSPVVDVEERVSWDFGRIEDNKDKFAVAWEVDKTAAICRATCEQNPDKCLAWTFVVDKGECWVSPSAVAGRLAENTTSGLNIKRMEELKKACPEQDWRQSVLRKAASSLFPMRID